MPEAVKFVAGSDTTLRILAIPFFGPEELGGRDLDDEFFSKSTNLCTSWYPVQRPLLYEHGRHPDTDVSPIGKVDSTTVSVEDDVGVWVEAELDRQAQYYEHIRRLVEQKKLYASSGAVAHLVRRDKSGEITRWPWCELFLTPTPANPLARVEAKTAVKHYQAAGLTPPPTIDPDDALPYADLYDRLTDDSGDFLDLARRLTEGRTKVGRALSQRRREQLLALAAQWESGASDLRQIVEEAETAPRPEERGTAAEAPPADAPPAAAAAGDTEAGDDAGKAAGHAPRELLAIFEQFQKDESFYGAVFPGRRG